MNRKRLNKIKREIAQARRSPQRASDLIGLALSLGRQKVKRGKEPMYASRFLGLFVLAIPYHGGKDLPPGTKNSILNQLGDDILEWERELGDEGEENGTGDGNGSG